MRAIPNAGSGQQSGLKPRRQKNLTPCRIPTWPNDYTAWAQLLTQEEAAMKFICLGYMDPNNWAEMAESERKSFMEKCFAYDDELRKGGHFLNGEALEPPQKGVTVRWGTGRVLVTDGPYAETKEQLGGILFLEARDLKHATELMARHPGVRAGGFEIRPANEEINALIASRSRAVSR
jgi:hypothetical protein